MDEEDMHQEEEFLLEQMRRYRMALQRFRVDRSYWRSRIPEFANICVLQQKHTEIQPYEAILYGLKDRPNRLPFNLEGDPDELDDFCDALVIAWRLFPDCWTGLQMMLDYLAENTLSSDLARIGEQTLVVVKEMTKNRHWPSNPFVGPMMMAGQAKTLLARVTRNVSFPHATTVSFVRAMNGTAVPSQPTHRKPKGYNSDRRRTCSRPECFQVEEAEAFKRCSRCKKVKYCSTACQRDHWTIHKKVCSEKKRK